MIGHVLRPQLLKEQTKESKLEMHFRYSHIEQIVNNVAMKSCTEVKRLIQDQQRWRVMFNQSYHCKLQKHHEHVCAEQIKI